MRPALLALVLCAACGSAPAPVAPPMNLVVITVDTLRAGHLGTYGYFRDTSPVLDAFAEEALVFEHCSVPMATTLPSHFSLFTATLPLEHGIVANVRANGRRIKPPEALATLAELLADEGYETAGFVSCTPLKRKSGIQVGFETFCFPKGGQRRAPRTNAEIFDWIDERGPSERPFFLWAHYYDPHAPFNAPKPLGDLFRGAPGLADYMQPRAFGEEVMTVNGKPFDARESIDGYDGEVRYTDAAIGELFARLKREGMWERTIVVVTADHGESLGQHDQAGHGGIWQEQLWVPLMIRVPGLEPRRIETPLASIDVLPTLFSLAPLPGGGRLAQQATGRDALGDEGGTARFSVTNERHLMPGLSAEYALVEGDWKYVLRVGGEDALFDLARDPFELVDRLADEPERAARMSEQLASSVRAQLERADELRAGQEGADSSDELEELRALGYL